MTFLLYTSKHTRPGTHCKVCRKALGFANKSGVCGDCKRAARANNVRECECGKKIVIHKGKTYSQCWQCRHPTTSTSGKRSKYGEGYTEESLKSELEKIHTNPFKEVDAAIRKAT